MSFDLTQCSGHYLRCLKDKGHRIGRLVLYDFHGLTVTQSLVKLFRYESREHPRDQCFLDALEETFSDIISGGRGDWVLFVGQGSDRQVPLQIARKKDNWLYPYSLMYLMCLENPRIYEVSNNKPYLFPR